MKAAAFLGLLAARVAWCEPAMLRDEVNVVPPGQWRYDRFVLKEQLPAIVDCTFVVAAPGRARVELMTRENLQSLLHGEAYETIAKSRSGQLLQEIGVPGEYAVAVINEEKSHEARVAIRLSLDFENHSARQVRYLAPERKRAVILLSCFGFLTIVTLAARTLLLAIRRA